METYESVSSIIQKLLTVSVILNNGERLRIENMNFNTELIAFLRSLDSRQKGKLQVENTTTDTFIVSRGVRQGCTLSLHQFSIDTENIMRRVKLDER